VPVSLPAPGERQSHNDMRKSDRLGTDRAKFQPAGILPSRPSAAGAGYDPTSSAGSNYRPTNQKLVDRVQASIAAFYKENPKYHGPIPADLPTTSASGLDPHISPDSARAT
jgi:K+-transporting ATPase ATPase C chain